MIIDSSVLLPLSRVGRLSLLRDLFGKVIITDEVYQETVKEATGKIGVSAIEQACNVDKWIEIRSFKDKKMIKKLVELECIAPTDASLILLAEELNEPLLANDYVLIKLATARGVNCWWLTTFILKLISQEKKNGAEGKQILFELVENGMRLSPQVYAVIIRKIDEI